MTFTQAQRHVDLHLEQPVSFFDTAIEWVLAAALLFAPLAYGAVDPWSAQVLYSIIAVAALLFCAKLTFVRGSRVVWTWAYVPIVLYLLLVTLSLIPLPAGVIKTISPGTLQEKLKLLSDLPDAAQRLSKLTITYNVWTTERGLRLVLALSVVFVIIVNVYRTPAQIRRLLITVATAGGVVALIALAQDLTHVPGEPFRRYWNIPGISLEAGHPNAGPFAGHSMLGQYLNLTIGAMLALAFWNIGQTFAGDDPNLRDVLESSAAPAMRWAVILFACAGLTAIAVAWALARGSLIGFAVASLTTAALLVYQRGVRGRETAVSITALLGVAVALGVGYLLLESHMNERTGDVVSESGSRLEILQNMRPLFTTWPVMGSGLESFEWVFPMFSKMSPQPAIYDHAENDYAQTLTDTGVIGAAITAAFIVMLVARVVRLIRRRDVMSLAVIGVSFGLLAVMVNSTSDFSQRTSAIALQTAVLIGIVFAMPLSPRVVSGNASPVFGWSPLPGGLLLIVMAGAMAWSLVTINGVRLADNTYYNDDPPIPPLPFKADDPHFDADVAAYFAEPIAANEKAVEYDPLYVRYPMYLCRYQWRAMSARRDPKTTAIVYPPNAAEVAKTLVEKLSAARLLCPSYGRLYAIMGKVQYDLLDQKKGLENLKTARRLWPNDVESALFLTEAAADGGDWESAVKDGKVCDSMQGGFDPALLDLFTKRFNRPDIAEEVLNDRSEGLGLLADRLRDDHSQAGLLQKVMERRVDLLQQASVDKPREGGVWADLAEARAQLGEFSQAADAYQMALGLDYNNVDWRVRRARVLIACGQPADARKELNICLTIRPQMSEAEDLLSKIDHPDGGR